MSITKNIFYFNIFLLLLYNINIKNIKEKNMSKKDMAIPSQPATPALPSQSADPATPAQPATIPGYQTSEFWQTIAATVIPNIITILAICKVIPTEVVSVLSTAVVAIISGLITVFVTLKYIKSRTDIKIRSIEIEQMTRERCRSKQLDQHNQEMDQYNQEMDRKRFILQQQLEQHSQEMNRKHFILQLYEKEMIDKATAKKELKLV